MKKSYQCLEAASVSFICAFFASLSVGALRTFPFRALLTALLCTGAVLVYLYGLRPMLENLFSGTRCENTQADQYRCEDESETTREDAP